MKIVEIIPNLDEGGAERLVVDLCNEFVSSNEVHLIIFFLFSQEKFLFKELHPKIKVHVLDKKMGFDLRIIFKLYQLIKAINPDIVHTHLGAIKYCFYNSLFFNKIKFFHTIHNQADKEQTVYMRNFLSIFYKKKKVIPITISKASDQSFGHHYPKVSRILIENGRKNVRPTKKFEEAERQINNIRNDSKILVNVGRISEQKNQKHLVNIIKNLNESNYKIKLFIIGGIDPERIDLFKDLQSLLDNNIYLLGSKDNVPDYLFLADAFILSSRYEGLPISLIEAINAGCIPICTPVGGISQIITDNVTGYLSENCSASALRKAILNWYTATERDKKKIRENCQNLYNKLYSIDVCAYNYIEAFKSVQKN